MTNYERIKSMTVDEMCKFVLDANSFCTALDGVDCIHGWRYETSQCAAHAKEWLESEATDSE